MYMMKVKAIERDGEIDKERERETVDRVTSTP
jgi:hypothetical protein